MWGLAGVAVKFAFVNRSADPATLVQFRITLSFLILGLALRVWRPQALKVRAADLPFLFAYGAVGLAAVQFFYYLAIREASVAVAIFLQYLAPVFTALYEILVLGRRPGGATFAVIALALGGSALLLFGHGGVGQAPSPLGIAAGLAASAAFAFYSVAARHGLRRHDPWGLLFWGMAMGSLVWAVLRPPWVVLAQPWSLGDWAFFLYLALFSSVVPFGLFLTGLRHIGPTSAVITATLEPVWAGLLAFVLLGERLGPLQVAGAAFILGAVIALQTVPGAALEEAPRATRPTGGNSNSGCASR